MPNTPSDSPKALAQAAAAAVPSIAKQAATDQGLIDAFDSYPKQKKPTHIFQVEAGLSVTEDQCKKDLAQQESVLADVDKALDAVHIESRVPLERQIANATQKLVHNTQNELVGEKRLVKSPLGQATTVIMGGQEDAKADIANLQGNFDEAQKIDQHYEDKLNRGNAVVNSPKAVLSANLAIDEAHIKALQAQINAEKTGLVKLSTDGKDHVLGDHAHPQTGAKTPGANHNRR